MTESLPKSVWTVLTTVAVGGPFSPPLRAQTGGTQVLARRLTALPSPAASKAALEPWSLGD